MLYVPGDKARALEKVRTLPVDGMIVDLEDAVAPDKKAVGRETIEQAFGNGSYGSREVLLRVSSADCEADFALADRLPIDGLLLPKVEGAATLAAAAARTTLPLWCMIETPLGVLRAAEIAAVPQVAGLVAGTNDLNKDLNARHTADRLPLLFSLSQIVLAARAFGRAAIDGVHLDLDDAEGFEAACKQGRDLGFDGKTLVHPATIEPANRLFGPDPEAIAQARHVVAAWEQARAQGLVVARIDGRMVEQLHVDEAQRLIALADAIAGTE